MILKGLCVLASTLITNRHHAAEQKEILFANVAQLVELLICNQPVGGSSPSIGSWRREDSRVAKWGRL